MKREENKIVGNRKKSNHFTGWGDFESARGRARGLVIEDLPCPAAVNALGFRLKHNDWDSVAFRVEFYAFADNGLDTLINQQDIVFNVEGKKDWTELDLSDYQIRLCDQVVVVLEWVDAWGTTGEYSNQLTFSTNNKTGLAYIKKKRQIKGEIKEQEGVPSIYLKLYE